MDHSELLAPFHFHSAFFAKFVSTFVKLSKLALKLSTHFFRC